VVYANSKDYTLNSKREETVSFVYIYMLDILQIISKVTISHKLTLLEYQRRMAG